MAAYSYQQVFHRDDYHAAIEPAMKGLGLTASEYEEDPGYDGDGWYVASYLLDQKDEEIKRLKTALALLPINKKLVEASKRLLAMIGDLQPADHLAQSEIVSRFRSALTAAEQAMAEQGGDDDA